MAGQQRLAGARPAALERGEGNSVHQAVAAPQHRSSSTPST